MTFTGREKSVPDLKLSLVKSLLGWMNAFPLFSFANMFEMLSFCV